MMDSRVRCYDVTYPTGKRVHCLSYTESLTLFQMEKANGVLCSVEPVITKPYKAP